MNWRSMNWRDPKIEMPRQGQYVWLYLRPHKDRGSLIKSAASTQIVCGEVAYYSYGDFGERYCVIHNYDELGSGSISWHLGLLPDEYSYNQEDGIAWIPVEEMSYPKFYKD